MDLRELVKRYLESQEKKVVEISDIEDEDKQVKYLEGIQKFRKIEGLKIEGLKGEEEMVRVFIVTKLVNELGYNPKNIELGKTYELGRPEFSRVRIDLIVRDGSGNAFLYIKLKSPKDYEKDKDGVIEKQLFNLAFQEEGKGKRVKYLVLYTVGVDLGRIKDQCIVIDRERFGSFRDWKKVRDFADEIPARYGKAQKKPYIRGSEKDLETHFTFERLDAMRKNLHNVLWGGGGTDDQEIFSSLVRLILAKVQDELETEEGKKYQFQSFSFKDGESLERNSELFERINDLYRRSLKNKFNILDEKKREKSFVIDENKFSLNKLKYTVLELEGLSFVEGRRSFEGKDFLGNFFEGIIREGFKQTKGQFLTHIHIVKFLLWGLQLDKLAIQRINEGKELPYLIDPSAGSGTFLIEAMKFISGNVKRRFKNKLKKTREITSKVQSWFFGDRENEWAGKSIYGIEINFDLGTASKVNMILHGAGSENILIKDGLLPFQNYEGKLKHSKRDGDYFGREVNEQFDCLVTNPPFSIDLDRETKEELRGRFLFGGNRNSENLFIERWYQLLKPGGRLGVVLPESIFDTTENKPIRLFIYKYFKVKAVVSLPQLTFEPYTSTKTSLLFAQKKTKEELRKWNENWDDYSKEWKNLKTRYESGFEGLGELGEEEKEEEKKEDLRRMLRMGIGSADCGLSSLELVEKYGDELKGFCKWDKSTGEIFGNVNTHWVFGEVGKILDYKILMAEVESIGYKRTERGEKPTLNELYRVNSEGEILVDDKVKETALDHLRGVEWD